MISTRWVLFLLLAAGPSRAVQAQSLQFQWTFGKQSFGPQPGLEYVDSVAPRERTIAEILSPGWENGFRLAFDPIGSIPLYAGVGLQWTGLKTKASGKTVQDSATQGWNTFALEGVLGMTAPGVGRSNIYAELGYAFRQLRPRDQEEEKPHRKWQGGGFEVAFGFLFPLRRTSKSLMLDLGLRGADFGIDKIDLTQLNQADGKNYGLPEVDGDALSTLYLGLRWHP